MIWIQLAVQSSQFDDEKDAKRFCARFSTKLDCGPMPNVMAVLPNIVAPSAQRRKVWLTPTTSAVQ